MPEPTWLVETFENPPMDSGMPLEVLYEALERITDEDVKAAGESLLTAGREAAGA